MSNVYVCICKKQGQKTRGVWGDAPPGNFLEIRCSEIASGAIFGQKQSRSSYYIFHPMLGSPICILLSQLTSNFHKRKY